MLLRHCGEYTSLKTTIMLSSGLQFMSPPIIITRTTLGPAAYKPARLTPSLLLATLFTMMNDDEANPSFPRLHSWFFTYRSHLQATITPGEVGIASI
jgi:hypothetical protein